MKGSTKVLLAVLISAIIWCFTLGVLYDVWMLGDQDDQIDMFGAIGMTLTMLWFYWDIDSGQRGETVGPFYIVINHIIKKGPQLWKSFVKLLDKHFS